MSEKDNTYNGWTNYETWLVKLRIDNEESSSLYWREIAQEVWDESTPGNYAWQTRAQQFSHKLAERLKGEHEENSPAGISGFYADLINAALSEVNWQEIAEHYLDAIDRSDTEDAATEEARK